MVTQQTTWTINRIVAFVIGIVFLIVGILGLILDTTSGSLLGFDVDLVHNLVHLLTGILGLAAAFTGWSRRFNQIFGIIYLLVGIAGLIPALYFDQRLHGLMHVNAADNVLHLVVGILAAAVGFFVTDYGTTRANADTMARP
jgi:drug/metabolite transporter (DMT)-like permease